MAGTSPAIYQADANASRTQSNVMKLTRIITSTCMAAAFVAGGVSCSEKGPGEKAGEKIDDVLDQRPAEGVRDKVEDAVE